MLQTLVLARREQLEPDCTMLARMLIVISKSIHILVSPLTIADATCKWAQPAFCLAFHLT